MSTPTHEPGDPGRRWTVRRALTRFIAAGAVALVCITVATVLVASQISNELALRHARTRGTTFAEAVSGPLVNDGLRRGDPDTVDAYTEVMENRLKDRSIEHIKVWDRDGKVLWSDEAQLRGRVFHLEAPVRRLFDHGGTVAAESDLQGAENALDHGEGPLLEVYVGTRDADGVAVVVESYWATSEIDDDARAILVRLGPLPLGALLLFTAVMLPLVLSFARRIEAAQAESRRSLMHALSAAELERRRVARDLHDGVMQEIGGAGYALEAASRSLPPAAIVSRRLISDVTTSVLHVGESLRFLLADIYPPNLAQDGLLVAVEELAAREAREGLVVDVESDAPEPPGLPLEVVQLCYRVIREALRNVQRHAEATHARVHVAWGPAAAPVTLVVTDNGRGLAPPVADEPLPTQPADEDDGSQREPVHLGLRLLEDTLRDVGGSLEVTSPPVGEVSGTELRATVPRHVVQS